MRGRMGGMSTGDHLLVWAGAVPALLSGVAMLALGHIAGALASLALGVAMMVAAVYTAKK